MSKVITDENQLNTEVDDLITEDYALEVLGLKNPADFRKFSRSFMKLSKIAKGIENVSNKVANKTELGRVKIGDNLTITEDGTLSGNPEYTHPVGAGYKHIPTGGTVGQVLKNNGNGSAEWGNLSLENYYTKPEIDTKFKNYCPISVGSIDVRYDNKNPAELYPSTTWELLTTGKYIQTGNTPLQTGGSNSVSILKENLPNIKLKIDSVSATIKNHYHFIAYGARNDGAGNLTNTNYLIKECAKGAYTDSFLKGVSNVANVGKTSDSGSGSTSSISPSTEVLGNGTPLTIEPSYITLKFWKRLT
ncbi:hypothetical protein I6E17_08905 [Fusobacterium perfoetens]|uniref:hypothetical protein n=1 Tax=Fusobacterium perfoetens TaxID=852 RepID=UPI001F1A4B46|nr:hypothetical protein [Fusobacterium perfoetens]MCF2626270.1 hypothetical protein [Fusobacterium perfoetens]